MSLQHRKGLCVSVKWQPECALDPLLTLEGVVQTQVVSRVSSALQFWCLIQPSGAGTHPSCRHMSAVVCALAQMPLSVLG